MWPYTLKEWEFISRSNKLTAQSYISIFFELPFHPNQKEDDMPKKKKEETITDILDRIEEDMIALRDKVEEMENQEDSDDDSFDNEDED